MAGVGTAEVEVLHNLHDNFAQDNQTFLCIGWCMRVVSTVVAYCRLAAGWQVRRDQVELAMRLGRYLPGSNEAGTGFR